LASARDDDSAGSEIAADTIAHSSAGVGELLAVRVHRDLLDALNAARAAEKDKPSRPEMLRRAAVEHLKSAGFLPKK
jgi:hypothetical protein